MACGGQHVHSRGYGDFDIICTNCKRSGKTREVAHFCTECQEYMCSSCAKKHRGFDHSLTGYSVLRREDFQSNERKDKLSEHGSSRVLLWNAVESPDTQIEKFYSINAFYLSDKNTEIVERDTKRNKDAKHVQHQGATLQKCKKSYSVRVKSDTADCDIVSSLFYGDEKVLLSDYSNKRVKQLDSSTYSVTDYCDTSGYPWQLCLISAHEVAVSLTGKREVMFISLRDRMVPTKEIKVDFPCYGLAYADRKIYISSMTSVYVYTLSGTKLNRRFTRDRQGQQLFSNIESIAVSEDDTTIYVSDCKKGLVVLDANGHVRNKYNGSQLRGAFGCFISERSGNLFVCGKYSNNLMHFKSDGSLIGQVLKSDKKIANWQTVCSNKQLSTIIIGKDKNEIEVYDFSVES